jgi:hypothetical protein
MKNMNMYCIIYIYIYIEIINFRFEAEYTHAILNTTLTNELIWQRFEREGKDEILYRVREECELKRKKKKVNILLSIYIYI